MNDVRVFVEILNVDKIFCTAYAKKIQRRVNFFLEGNDTEEGEVAEEAEEEAKEAEEEAQTLSDLAYMVFVTLQRDKRQCSSWSFW